jgi:hypothetical protein
VLRFWNVSLVSLLHFAAHLLTQLKEYVTVEDEPLPQTPELQQFLQKYLNQPQSETESTTTSTTTENQSRTQSTQQ